MRKNFLKIPSICTNIDKRREKGAMIEYTQIQECSKKDIPRYEEKFIAFSYKQLLQTIYGDSFNDLNVQY